MKKQLIQLIFIFLIMVISAGQAFAHREDCDVYDVDVAGYSEVEFFADRIWGFAQTEIEATVSNPPFYCFDYEFYADIESVIEGPNVYSSQEESGNPDATSVEVDHDDVEAEPGTYCVTSNHQYGGSFTWNDHDGNDVLVILTGDGFNQQSEACLTIDEEPTPTPTPFPTPTPTPTPNVISVTFSQVNPSTEPISQNPQVLPHNPGIGERIFPDDDTPQDGVDRRLVRVTATLSQPIANVPVYFRNFDLDDPATDPIIDAAGAAGNDNNGTPNAGTLSLCATTPDGCQASTNPSGVAVIEFTITRQPGDNFAIAAGTIPSEVASVTMSGTDLIGANGQNLSIGCTTQRVCRSEMLTVWRRLHIEVDSMGIASQNNYRDVLNQNEKVNPGQQRTLVLFAPNSGQLEFGRFEGGRMTDGTRSVRIDDNTDTSVTVTNTGAVSLTFAANTSYTLYDDDDFNNDDGTNMDGDSGEDISEPDLALLTANSDDPNSNSLATAYVQPIRDAPDTRDNGIFAAHSLGREDEDIRAFFVDWDSSATNAAERYWSVFLLGAYQGEPMFDRDPSNEDLLLGIVDAITLVTDDGEGSGALIFLEGHRTRERPGYSPAPTNLNSMAVTVAHEVGHLFSCVHGDGGLLGTDPLLGSPVSNQLSPTMIFKIRDITHP